MYNIFIFFISFLSSYASCIYDDAFNSIVWKEKSFPFEISENYLFFSGNKFFLQDYRMSSRKGIICFSRDEKYAKITQPIQCKGCFPSLGYFLFEVASDTLKQCDFISKIDIDSLEEETRKIIYKRKKIGR